MIRVAALVAIAAANALAQTPPPKAPAPAPRKPAVAAKLPNYGELKYPELRQIPSPAIESLTLPNGMRLLLLENHELPLIDGTVLVRTGSVFDPPDKAGLAGLTAQVLLEGSTRNSPGDSLFRQFQDQGAEIEGSVSENSLSVSFSVPRRNSDTVLEALRDGLTAPEFPQDRIDLAKMHLRNTIAHRNDDAAAILRREFAATVYGKKSPYTAQVEYDSVDRINRGDLVDFYRRYFFPKNVILSLEGDFDAARMKGRMETVFADWKSEQPAVPEFPKIADAGAPGKFLAVKKDVSRSYFSVGQIGGDHRDKDYAALVIMADILGGGPQGRLNLRLRNDVETLVASWSAGFDHPGLFEVSGTLSNPFVTTKTIRAVFEELNSIRTVEVSEQELKTAKSSAVNSLVFTFDNQLSILPRVAQYRYFNLPGDYTQQYQKALEGVTRADVLRVARERLDPGKMTTVVIGNPVAFEAPLESLGGPVTPIELTIPPGKPEATLGDAGSQRRAKELLTRAQQAMGGAGKLAAVTDYTQEILYQFDVSTGGAQATMMERWMAPSYLRQDNSLPAGKVSVYCDGKTGWVASPEASSALIGVQLKQVQSDLFRILFPLILSDRMPNRKVTALDENTVEVSDSTGQIAKLVFDSATGLIQNILYDAPTANGPVPVLETYTDYREVSGLQLPAKVAITLSGKKFQDLTIKSIQLNTGLKIQDLEKRP